VNGVLSKRIELFPAGQINLYTVYECLSGEKSQINENFRRELQMTGTGGKVTFSCRFSIVNRTPHSEIGSQENASRKRLNYVFCMY
jgi:hypothetical protein